LYKSGSIKRILKQWWAKTNRDSIQSRIESHVRFDSNVTWCDL